MSAAKKFVTDKVNSIIGREVERATTEVKKKLRAVGLGVALLVVAAVLAVFGLGLLSRRASRRSRPSSPPGSPC